MSSFAVGEAFHLFLSSIDLLDDVMQGVLHHAHKMGCTAVTIHAEERTETISVQAGLRYIEVLQRKQPCN